MEYFRRDVKVGAMLLATLVLGLGAALTVGNLGNWFADKQSHTIFFRNTNLLPEGSRVSYAGFPVGRIAGIEVRTAEARAQQHSDYPVAVTIIIQSEVPLRRDSRVEMKTDGMIGDRYIDILPGVGEPVAPGETVLGSIGGFDGLLASFDGVDGGVQDLMTGLRTLLTDASRSDSIPGALASLRRLIDAVYDDLPPLTRAFESLSTQIQQDVSSTSQSAQRLLQDLDVAVNENRPDVRRLMARLNTTLEDTGDTMAAAKTLLETSRGETGGLIKEMRELVQSVQENRQAVAAQVETLLKNIDALVAQNDRHLFEAIENLRDMTAHLKSASELVRANPAVVIWGHRDEANPTGAASVSQQTPLLQDRGRVGRYDRVR